MHTIVDPPGAHITVVIQHIPLVAAVRQVGLMGIAADRGHIAVLTDAVPTMMAAVGEMAMIHIIAAVKVEKTITVILTSLYAADPGRARTAARAERPVVTPDAAVITAAAVVEVAPVMTMTIAIVRTTVRS